MRVGGWIPGPRRAAGHDKRALQDEPTLDDELMLDEHRALDEHPAPHDNQAPSSRPAPSDDEGRSVVDGKRSTWESSAARVRAMTDAVAVSWDLRRGHVVVVVVLLLLAVVGAGAMVLRHRPVREPVTEPVARVVSPGTPAPTTMASSSPSPAVLVVHVAGKVRRPGVLRLPAGSRVGDAVTAAGGPLAGVDLSSINLARPLGDGEQVLVGTNPAAGTASTGSPLAPGVGGGPGGGPAGPATGVVDLNTATIEQLDTLPGLGPVLAQRIIEFRTTHGRFDSVDELRDVTGIGERKFADLRGRVTVT